MILYKRGLTNIINNPPTIHDIDITPILLLYNIYFLNIILINIFNNIYIFY